MSRGAGPGVRVCGGELRGRILRVPVGARPTEGRVKEALFSIWGERVRGAIVLDLFGGSAAIAIEALSRGAAQAVAVDESAAAVAAARENFSAAGVVSSSMAVRGDVLSGLLRLPAVAAHRYDLVFADPPYEIEAWEALARAVEPVLAEQGELVIEHSRRRELASSYGGLIRDSWRDYGETRLTFFRREVAVAEQAVEVASPTE